MTEIWKPIEGWEGCYDISDAGRVRSLARDTGTCYGARQWRQGRILKPDIRPGGYCMVDLQCNGVIEKILVHRLVAAAFIANPDGKPHVNHLDGVPSNNMVFNLEWATPSENSLHSYRELGRKSPPGCHLYGTSNPMAKLSEEDVRRIRDMKGTMSQRRIGELFGVTQSNVYYIHKNKSRIHG